MSYHKTPKIWNVNRQGSRYHSKYIRKLKERNIWTKDLQSVHNLKHKCVGLKIFKYYEVIYFLAIISPNLFSDGGWGISEWWHLLHHPRLPLYLVKILAQSQCRLSYFFYFPCDFWFHFIKLPFPFMFVPSGETIFCCRFLKNWNLLPRKDLVHVIKWDVVEESLVHLSKFSQPLRRL